MWGRSERGAGANSGGDKRFIAEARNSSGPALDKGCKGEYYSGVGGKKFLGGLKNNQLLNTTDGAQIVGMSALLSTTMQNMKPVTEALEEAGLKGQVKTMVAGAIVAQQYADEIGADGYAPDAGSAVDKAEELLGLR